METTEKVVELILLIRSENEINLKLLVNEVETLASLFGLSVTPSDEYYGWSYDPDSQLRKSYKEAYKKHMIKNSKSTDSWWIRNRLYESNISRYGYCDYGTKLY